MATLDEAQADAERRSALAGPPPGDHARSSTTSGAADPAPRIVPRSTSAVRPCPVCAQPVASQVCGPCGVDVDTGDLVAAPTGARVGASPGSVTRIGGPTAPRERPVAPPWSARDVVRGLVEPRALLPTLIAAWVVLSLQLAPSALQGFGGGGIDAPSFEAGPAGLAGQLVGLLVLVWLAVSRASGVVKSGPPFVLVELGEVLLASLPFFGLLALVQLVGFAAVPVAALAAPLLLSAAASERPWGDLSPTSLFEVARRAPGSFVRALVWSLAALGPGLVAARWAPPLAVWRPLALVAAFTLAGLAAGYLRREAETAA